MSKLFIVARVSFFTNNLTQERVEADSDIEAILQIEPALKDAVTFPCTQKELQDVAFDMDMLVSAYEVSPEEFKYYWLGKE